MFSYVHIPFCESKCKYCRFASLWGVNYTQVDFYVASLIANIKEFSHIKKSLESVYFGWWTPGILKKNHVEKILETLKNTFWFQKNIEISLESTPQNLTRENLEDWKNLWVNRISFGIQTLNNDSLKEIWRTDKKTIFQALEHLKNSGIENISCDFIIGLPYVKKWEILENIQEILENFPFLKHISVYMLEDYYDIDDQAKMYEKITYPDRWEHLGIPESEYENEYNEIKNYLQTKWFFRYEISNFAKPWFECKHNQSYWNHSENIGFWLWAHGFLEWKRYAYTQDFIGYYKRKMEYEEILSDEDIFLEKLLFWLRTSWISHELFPKLSQTGIQKCREEGLIEFSWDKIILTDIWYPLMDYVLKEII